MAIFSPLRSRRFARNQTEPTIHLIAFSLRQQWFALPILQVVKVVPMGNLHGDPKQFGIAVTVYQDQELLVLDVGHRIFQDTPSASIGGAAYLLIVQNSTGDLVGIPIDAPPTLRRVPESACKPLPEDYMNYGNIKCVSDIIVEQSVPQSGAKSDHRALFLLNAEQLTVNFGGA